MMLPFAMRRTERRENWGNLSTCSWSPPLHPYENYENWYYCTIIQTIVNTPNLTFPNNWCYTRTAAPDKCWGFGSSKSAVVCGETEWRTLQSVHRKSRLQPSCL